MVSTKKSIIEKIQPRDIMAVLLLVGAIILRIKGLDGSLDVVVGALVGYYLSKRVYEEKNE